MWSGSSSSIGHYEVKVSRTAEKQRRKLPPDVIVILKVGHRQDACH